MQSVRNILFPLLVVLVSLVCIVPLFHQGFFPIHDNTQIARVFQMHESLADGMMPVRWVSDLGYGYGYPIFSFYAPLAYYVGGLIMLMGFPALVATKWMIGIGFILAGVSMYLLAKEFWGEKGGLIAGVLYALAPYHGINLYVRGAISEMWAYACIPLAFYGIWKITRMRNWRVYLIGSVGVAGIILSHNLTAMMVIPFIGVLACSLVVFYRKEARIAFLPLLVVLTGFLLSAFYWLPAILELGFTNVASQAGGGSDYKDHFVCISQLWSSLAGFGGSAPGCVDGISLQLGKIHIVLLLLSLGLSFLLRKKKIIFIPLVIAQVIAMLGVFFMIDISKPVWDSISPMKYFQFPWRFQTLFLLGASFAAGAFSQMKVAFIKKHSIATSILVLVVCVGALALYQKFFIPQSYVSDASMQEKSLYVRSVISRISDEYMPKNFKRPSVGEYASVSLPSTKGLQVVSYDDRAQIKSATYSSENQMKYVSNIAYFPAWHVTIDGKETPTFSDKGRLAFVLLQGSHNLVISYRSTDVQRIGNVLSIGGIFLLAVAIIAMNRKVRNDK